jgi:hypothetical protein
MAGGPQLGRGLEENIEIVARTGKRSVSAKMPLRALRL